MKVEDCIVTVERRSVGGCLDLAFVFAREFSGPITRLWLLCAIPSCGFSWMLASNMTDAFIPSCLIFLFFTSLFSAFLVGCMGPQVFGVPISVRAAVRTWRKRFFAWLLLTAMARFFQAISGFCFVFPSVFVTAYVGHLPEVLLLEQSKLNSVTTRLSWLCGGGGYGRNLGRLVSLLCFWLATSFGLFLMMDLLGSTLINTRSFFESASSANVPFDEAAMRLIYDDPQYLLMLHLAMWIPYPIVRLAWFFCYLDQRIRNECWDLQLTFRAEAVRLEGAAT